MGSYSPLSHIQFDSTHSIMLSLSCTVSPYRYRSSVAIGKVTRPVRRWYSMCGERDKKKNQISRRNEKDTTSWVKRVGNFIYCTFTQKFDRLLFRYNHVTHFFLNFYTIHGVSHLFPFSKTFIFQQAFIFWTPWIIAKTWRLYKRTPLKPLLNIKHIQT